MRRIVLLVLLLLVALGRPALAAYECFSLPNAPSAAFSAQSKLFSQDLQVITEAIMQTGVVFSAAGDCLVQAQASPNMTTRITTGCTIAQHGATATVTTGNFTHSAAHASLNRIDLVSVDNTGAKVVTTGTAASSPLPPTIPQSGGFNNIVLAEVYVPAADSAINANQIIDKRACIPTPGGGGGGAPTTAKYWTEGSEAGLSAERNMSLLATGLIQNTTGTGIPTTIAPTDDNTVVGNGTTWQLKALPTCSGATSALTYNISTNAFGCNTISAGGTVTATAGALTLNALMLGAGTTDSKVMASLGTTSTLLHGNAAGAPTFAAVVSADLNLTSTTCTNQFVSAISSAAAGTCTTSTLAGAQHANQGTTTTLLHGNAAGNPTWSGIAIADHTATGTPSASTYYRGDNTWSTPAGAGTVTTSGSPANTQVALFTSATAITGDAGLVYDTAADTLTITQAAATGTASSTGALTVVSSGGGTGTFEVSDAATNTIVRPGLLRHTTSGAMTDGFGTAIDFEVRDNSAVNNPIGRISTERSGVDNTGHMRLRTANAGTFGDGVVISGTQTVTLPSLASGGTQCVQASSAGLLSGTGSACGGGGGGPTITTFATSDPSDATSTALTINSLTVRTVTRVFIPGAITLNQLSFAPGTVTTSGTMRLCLYSIDGATKLVDVVSGASASNTPTSTAVGSVVIPAGEYYFAMGCATTCNMNVLAFVAETGTATLFGALSPSGKPKWHGSVTHTSGTCNTTLGTITGTTASQPVVRGDN